MNELCRRLDSGPSLDLCVLLVHQTHQVLDRGTDKCTCQNSNLGHQPESNG